MSAKSRYYNISRREMESLIHPMKFELLNDPADVSRKSWPLDLRYSIGGKEVSELVYGCRARPLSRLLTVRVYSGIWLEGMSRAVGEDAIRVLLAWLDVEKYETFQDDYVKIIGVEKRVHRISTWAENLRKRICKWEEGLGPNCPECHKPLVERHKSNDASSKFWGCVGYNSKNPDLGCRYIRHISNGRK